MEKPRLLVPGNVTMQKRRPRSLGEVMGSRQDAGDTRDRTADILPALPDDMIQDP